MALGKIKLSQQILKVAPKVLIALIIAALLFMAGRSSVKQKTEIREVVKEVKVTLDETKLTELKTQIVSQIKEELDSKAKESSIGSTKNNTTTITKITETTKVIDRDPTTGKVIKETESQKTSDTGSAATTENTTVVAKETETKKTTDTNTNTNTNTTEVVNTKKTEEEKTITTEKKIEGPIDTNSSPLGIAVNIKGKPVITYQVLKLFKFSADTIAEIDVSKPTVSAAGVAITADINKHGDYFVGGYGQYNFKDKEEQYGVLVGRRF